MIDENHEHWHTTNKNKFTEVENKQTSIFSVNIHFVG